LSRFQGSVPGLQGSLGKKEWTQAIGANWNHIINPSTVAVVSIAWRSEPFNNYTPTGSQTSPVPIVNVPQRAPWAGPPSITIGSNGAGISDLFSRLYFNGATSTDLDGEISPTLTKTVGRHTVKAGFFYLYGVKTLGYAGPPYGSYTTASDFNNPRSTTSASGDAF